MNKNKEAAIIDGPEDVLNSSDANKPKITEKPAFLNLTFTIKLQIVKAKFPTLPEKTIQILSTFFLRP